MTRVIPRPVAADGSHHGGFGGPPTLPLIDPHPKFDALLSSLSNDFAERLVLWPHDPESLAGFGGEMDRALQMPGWTNVWTKPIQNRVDMLATGVNAEVGVRVLGRNFDTVVTASEQIAALFVNYQVLLMWLPIRCAARATCGSLPIQCAPPLQA